MDEQEPLTEIEQSRATTGYRHYVVQPDVYTAMVSAVDESRGYPNPTTLTGLPPVEQLAEAIDGSGLMIAIDCWRFNATDDQMLEAPLADGTLEEVSEQTYLSVKPEAEEL
jgi:hypothetical protein